MREYKMKEIAYLISHYIEAFIIFQYCHCIFKQKKSNSSVFFWYGYLTIINFLFIWNFSFSEYLCKHYCLHSCSIVFDQLFIWRSKNICFFSLACSLPVNGIRWISRSLPALLTLRSLLEYMVDRHSPVIFINYTM